MSKRVFQSVRDREASIRGFMAQHSWPEKYNLINALHEDCKGKHGRPGKIRAEGAGRYMAADWHVRQYISYRCDGCGCMIHFSWPEPGENEEPREVTKHVTQP
jgi:hypothetical protein